MCESCGKQSSKIEVIEECGCETIQPEYLLKKSGWYKKSYDYQENKKMKNGWRRKTEDLVYKFVIQMSDKELNETLFQIQNITKRFTPKD